MAKRGRQGYIVIYSKLGQEWDWRVETQNGAIVALAPRLYKRRWDATRSLQRLFRSQRLPFKVES